MRTASVTVSSSKLTGQAQRVERKVLGKNSDFVQKQASREDSRLIPWDRLNADCAQNREAGHLCRDKARKRKGLPQALSLSVSSPLALTWS